MDLGIILVFTTGSILVKFEIHKCCQNQYFLLLTRSGLKRIGEIKFVLGGRFFLMNLNIWSNFNCEKLVLWENGLLTWSCWSCEFRSNEAVEKTHFGCASVFITSRSDHITQYDLKWTGRVNKMLVFFCFTESKTKLPVPPRDSMEKSKTSRSPQSSECIISFCLTWIQYIVRVYS